MEGTKRKKGFLREEDVLLLLNKYSPTTILNLLKEVAQSASPKLEWDTLVKDSNTGISSAREYQMLWRYLAYQSPLLEKLEAGAEPLDDDSDLDFELEALPTVTGETLAEAAACVKTLISSGLPHELAPNRPTAEAPLSTNTSNGQASYTLSDNKLTRYNRGGNTMMLSAHRQLQTAAQSTEMVDGNGTVGATGPAKKKRKLWTKEEDLELIAAVDKCGEGNWANILKGDFKHDRTASQLSQRWSIIRKKRANLNVGSGCNPPGSAPTEAHMATWQAVNMAIKMPIIGALSTRRPGTTGALQSTDAAGSSAPSTASGSDPAAVSSSEAPNQSPQPGNPTTSQKVVALNHPPSKPRVNPKVPAVTVKSLGGPSSIIQAAAIAAGGRIAPPSTAASHFKAAQSKNAVHIRPGGALPSSSIPATKALPPVSIRCTKTPISPKEAATSPLGSRPSTHQGACGLSGQPSPSSDATAANQPAEQSQPELSPASPSCTDAEGNVEPRSAVVALDSSDGSPQVENKTPEEIISCDQEDLVKNMDTDSDDKICVYQTGDFKDVARSPEGTDPGMVKREDAGEAVEFGDSPTAADPETAKSEMPFLNTTEDVALVVKTATEGLGMTRGSPNGEMAMDITLRKDVDP
ncbi:unnamed protein product [Spirodela intermedia]|uniref:Uncharacterized protein n=1 Tax=Spirodela intermedia TaxID=51605 RepID=A0A7I8L8G6_SPIIN|nr:unnamed protein product [Spirodela intermedia]